MTRAIADNMFGRDSAFWDFVYQAVVIGLGIAAATAIYIDVSAL
jgi:hypothetical protein